MCGGLFERFEHRIKRMARQHVDFVDHVDLETAHARRIHRLLEELGHFVDPSVRGGIKLEIVYKTALINRRACTANAARGRSDSRFAIQCFGQNTR